MNKSLVFYNFDIAKAEIRTLIVMLEAIFEYTIDTHDNEKNVMRLDMCFTFLYTKDMRTL